MSWRQIVPHLLSATKHAATGATVTVFSCYLACEIEAAGHKTLFTFFPHWYQNVEFANGIDPDLLATVRMEARMKQEALEKQQQLLEQQQQQQTLQANQATTKNEDRFKTVFTVEAWRQNPVVKQVQELSIANDLSACAMTA